jgi:hypothetical protein
MAELNTIAGPQIAKLAGLSERRLRELATEGCFPKPVNGHINWCQRSKGCFGITASGTSNA